jgi:hypothetical protein
LSKKTANEEEIMMQFEQDYTDTKNQYQQYIQEIAYLTNENKQLRQILDQAD